MPEFFINLDREFKEKFDLGKFMNFSNDTFDVLTSNFIRTVKELESGGQRIIIGESDRPDLLSFRLYGSPQYWWILLIYNDLSSIEDLNEGQNISFPSLDAIESKFTSLKSAAFA